VTRNNAVFVVLKKDQCRHRYYCEEFKICGKLTRCDDCHQTVFCEECSLSVLFSALDKKTHIHLRLDIWKKNLFFSVFRIRFEKVFLDDGETNLVLLKSPTKRSQKKAHTLKKKLKGKNSFFLQTTQYS